MFHKSQRIFLQATNYLIVISIFIQMVFVTDIYAKWGIYKLGDGISYQNEGRYPEAITEYYQVLEAGPQNLYAYYNLAYIIEIVLEDFGSSIKFCDKAISIAENIKSFSGPETKDINKDELDTITLKLKERKKIIIQKIFNSIEGLSFPRYVVLKPGKKIFSKPDMNAKEISKSSVSMRKDVRFHKLKNNWYQVTVFSGEIGWVRGKDVQLVYVNSNERIELLVYEMIARYKEISNNFVDNNMSLKSKERIDELYYERARTKNTIDHYEHYLAECPGGKHVQEIKENLKKLTGPKPPSGGGQAVSTNILDHKDIERQLDKIERLYKKGLINSQEREELRMDVLRQL